MSIGGAHTVETCFNKLVSCNVKLQFQATRSRDMNVVAWNQFLCCPHGLIFCYSLRSLPQKQPQLCSFHRARFIPFFFSVSRLFESGWSLRLAGEFIFLAVRPSYLRCRDLMIATPWAVKQHQTFCAVVMTNRVFPDYVYYIYIYFLYLWFGGSCLNFKSPGFDGET